VRHGIPAMCARTDRLAPGLPETESIGAFHALQMFVPSIPHLTLADDRSRRREIPSRLLVFPDENHWVLDHGNRCVRRLELCVRAGANTGSAVSSGITRSSGGLTSGSGRTTERARRHCSACFLSCSLAGISELRV
jgi:hypothetical protein